MTSSVPSFEAALVEALAPPGEPATALQRQLRLPTDARDQKIINALRTARRMFLQQQRVDMGALATTLGVSRVTLYRWVGTREQLLVEVLWSLARQNLLTHYARAWAPDRPQGGRAIETLSAFARDTIANPGMRRFVDEESDLAIKLLTVNRSGFAPRMVQAVHRLLLDEVIAGERVQDVPFEDLAYAAVRLISAHVHSRRFTDEEPDPIRAHRVLHALLR